jgi:hypothetical protein
VLRRHWVEARRQRRVVEFKDTRVRLILRRARRRRAIQFPPTIGARPAPRRIGLEPSQDTHEVEVVATGDNTNDVVLEGFGAYNATAVLRVDGDDAAHEELGLGAE